MSIKRHLAAGFALALVTAALTGSALAAPPSTPPGQEKKVEQAAPAAQQPAAAPTQEQEQSADGKSAAPGQAKKAEQAAPAPAPASVSTTAKSKASSTSTATHSSGINATSNGVKPTNSTEQHTVCWTGGTASNATCTPAAGRQASPSGDSSKRYGNGTTAAQIAVGRGAPAATEIRGPGNSQPHKVCGKNGNWVDVHAVKSYVGICTTSVATPVPVTSTPTVTCPMSGTTLSLVTHKSDKHIWTKANVGQGHLKHGDSVAVTLLLATGESCTAVVPSTPTTTTTATTVRQVVRDVREVVEQALGTSVVATTTTAGSTGSAVGAAAGGVAGAQATQTSGGAGAAGGVLGALGTIGGAAGGTLPFTGFPLWLALLLAVTLVAAGALLWRRGEATARELA